MLIREMKLGDSASVTKTVTETDVYLFAGITGDLNPAHTNEVSASQTQFGGRIAHGILGAGFISAVLGMKLPGPGTIYPVSYTHLDVYKRQGRFATGCDVWSPSNFIAKIPKALCSAGKRFTFF